MLLFLGLMIVILGTINLIRIMFMMVGTDVYDLNAARKRSKKYRKPLISVIVPAYNEEKSILRCIDSLSKNDYVNKEIIVVNDGSTDKTYSRVKYWQSKNREVKLRLLNQANSGKAAAINYGINRSKGSLIMVLDADSILDSNALTEIPKYFTDRRIVMVAANVKIIDDGRLLSLIQKYEYLISYRLKKSLTTYNMEYIIGGVGSTFRKSMANRVGAYDTDTMTEDIDFTLKILSRGNITYRLGYASTVIAHTEGVLNVGDLIKQRYRWKYGRMQSFLKNKILFFNSHPRYDKRLTYYQLPYAIWAELMFAFEPLLIGYLIYIVLHYHELTTLFSAYLVTTIYIVWNILTDETESLKSKIKLAPLGLFQYPLFLILLVVEYLAFIKSVSRIRQLRSTEKHGTWEHVARASI